MVEGCVEEWRGSEVCGIGIFCNFDGEMTEKMLRGCGECGSGKSGTMVLTPK